MLQCLQHSYVKIPPPKMMVLGTGAFGRCLGPEGEVFLNGIGVLIKGAPGDSDSVEHTP